MLQCCWLYQAILQVDLNGGNRAASSSEIGIRFRAWAHERPFRIDALPALSSAAYLPCRRLMRLSRQDIIIFNAGSHLPELPRLSFWHFSHQPDVCKHMPNRPVPTLLFQTTMVKRSGMSRLHSL